jgi:hypothetical protein
MSDQKLCDYDFGVQPHNCGLEKGHDGPHECPCGATNDPWHAWLNQEMVGWDDLVQPHRRWWQWRKRYTEQQSAAIMMMWFATRKGAQK